VSYEFLLVAILFGVKLTLFSLFSAGGNNGIQLVFDSVELALCTKIYACDFSVFYDY